MTSEFPFLSVRFGLCPDAVERTFDRLIHAPWGCPPSPWAPVVDIFETEQEYVITAELPGVSPAAVEIRAEGDTLTISGDRRIVQVSQSGRAVKLERTSGHFSRSLQLGGAVDATRMTVRSDEGVLYVHLPKAGRVSEAETGTETRRPQVEG